MVIIPPTIVKLHEQPLVFLAGPIKGAADWQQEAITYIQPLNPHLLIANPRRPLNIDGDFTEEMYREQVDWETHHLRHAGKWGVVLFWLARESTHFCNRAYAQTTRFELGEWKERHCRDNVKLVVGIEKGFTNEDYIRRRLSQDCPRIHVFDSLEHVCLTVSILVGPIFP
ncbi:MAG: nucleoside 2-deoxyribosyltransferase domain-containing protein [bacterium]|nr:nucleoside 2-deoxyribosyltransferase domain-containing protein [bacterium]